MADELLCFAERGKETGIEARPSTDDEFRITDPKLALRGGVFRLTAGSPAVRAASNRFAYVDHDMDGTPRGDKRDVGADEYGGESGAERRRLASSDVGPSSP